MNIYRLGTFCALVIILNLRPAWADTPKVFAGMVSVAGIPAVNFSVSLYIGDGEDANFLTSRQFVASSRTDDSGAFVIVAPLQEVSGHLLTIRAKGYSGGNDSRLLGGQTKIAAIDVSGSTSTINLSITASRVVDNNYGIKRNRYASKVMYFITDRASASSGFANTAATDFEPSFGSFVGKVALGPPAKPSGKCAAATNWTCTAPPEMEDDAFATTITMIGKGKTGGETLLNNISRDLKSVSGHRPRILLFVHGYNTDFAGAAATSARLAYESGQQHDVVLVYSWPSAHRASKYAQDVKNVETSVATNLVNELNRLGTLNTQADIAIVAHSLGSSAVAQALSQYVGTPFASMTLFAGDLDDDLFLAKLPQLQENAKKITIYSNSGDQALRISACYSGDGRLRVGQTPQTFAVPIRWFDATPFAPHRDMGHAYLDESFEVAADFYVSQTGVPLSLAQTNLTALPWLGGVESGNPIDWGSAFASATCTIVKHLP